MSEKRKSSVSEYFTSFDIKPSGEIYIVFEELDQIMYEKCDEEEFLVWKGKGGSRTRRVQALSEEELEQLNKAIIEQPSTRKVGKDFYVASSHDIDVLIKGIIPESEEYMQPSLYKNVNSQEEIGVGRFIADRVFHLSGLLHSAEIQKYSDKDYGIYASKDLSEDSRLFFVHRFTASDIESAKEIAKHLKQQLNGIMRKIWLAAWAVGNEKKKMEFSLSIPQLMRACNPGRDSNFGEGEMERFYQALKSMEPAQFILEKKIGTKKKRGRIVDESIKYNISLLRVVAERGEMNKTPDSVLIHLFDVTPFPGKEERTRYVGMPVKRKTLEMNAKTISFAVSIQTRINQLQGGEKNVKYYDFHRAALIESACLQKTDAANPRIANARLLKRLAECKKAGIISKIPERIGNIVRLHWD